MSSIKYYVKGTLKGSRSYEDYTEDMLSIELVEYLDEIKSLFSRDPSDELAQYIYPDDERDAKIYGVVTEIWVGVKVIKGILYSWTEITATRELTEEEKEALLDYLTGQFSDGYGEGLEQHEFISYTDTDYSEEYDEETDEYYDEAYDVRVDCYLHLWQRDDFKLEFVEAVENTIEDAPKPTKPRCRLIGEDGNIFNLVGIAARALKHAGLFAEAKEMQNRVFKADSYSEALAIIMDYVEVE